MKNLPHFIIIGAMKAATSSLHEQLNQQPGIFMSDPKEPCFFSDDEQYALGINWYKGLFIPAHKEEVCGESSTHYTKLPFYPHTITRMKLHLPQAKLIYIMRHPIDRLVSQYIHQWTQKEISVNIHQALHQHPELIAYSQYCRQLTPYFEAYGKENILPLFFQQIRQHPQTTLERVCNFIGCEEKPMWHDDLSAQNVSSQRLRVNPWRDRLAYAPIITTLRHRFIPPSMRNYIKKIWQMQKRPELQPAEIAWLINVFDNDLAKLGNWLGYELSCHNFINATGDNNLNWV